MKNKIIDNLIEIDAVKLGKFELKSGIISPIYIDLRIIISYPKLLSLIANEMIKITSTLQFDRIASIPYTALPIGTAFSLASDVSMLYCRKEKKEYGTARQIEGVWKRGDQILLIDDLITDGSSKFETFEPFKKEGLVIKDVVVLIDREQGGRENLLRKGYELHSLISIYDILNRMKSLGNLSARLDLEIRDFLTNKQS